LKIFLGLSQLNCPRRRGHHYAFGLLILNVDNKEAHAVVHTINPISNVGFCSIRVTPPRSLDCSVSTQQNRRWQCKRLG
jgi:hypothetical protein